VTSQRGAIACARLILGPRADSIIARGLISTNEYTVRDAFAAALHRPYGDILATPVIALAKSGSGRTVRMLAIQVFGIYATSAPALVAVIADVAQRESDPEVCDYARNLAQKLSAP
jgi:hypothetical protein